MWCSGQRDQRVLEEGELAGLGGVGFGEWMLHAVWSNDVYSPATTAPQGTACTTIPVTINNRRGTLMKQPHCCCCFLCMSHFCAGTKLSVAAPHDASWLCLRAAEPKKLAAVVYTYVDGMVDKRGPYRSDHLYLLKSMTEEGTCLLGDQVGAVG